VGACSLAFTHNTSKLSTVDFQSIGSFRLLEAVGLHLGQKVGIHLKDARTMTDVFTRTKKRIPSNKKCNSANMHNSQTKEGTGRIASFKPRHMRCRLHASMHNLKLHNNFKHTKIHFPFAYCLESSARSLQS